MARLDFDGVGAVFGPAHLGGVAAQHRHVRRSHAQQPALGHRLHRGVQQRAGRAVGVQVHHVEQLLVRHHDDARVGLVRDNRRHRVAAERLVAPDGGGGHRVHVVGHHHAHVRHLLRVAEGAQARRREALQDAHRRRRGLRLARLGLVALLRGGGLALGAGLALRRLLGAAVRLSGSAAVLGLRRLLLFRPLVRLRLRVVRRHALAQRAQRLRRDQQRRKRRLQVQRAKRAVAQPPWLGPHARLGLLAPPALEQPQHGDRQVAVHHLHRRGGARAGVRRASRGGPSSRRGATAAAGAARWRRIAARACALL